MMDYRSRSARSRSSFSRNGIGRSVATKGSHATSRSRSRTRTPAPEKREEQILIESRRKGNIVNFSARSRSQTRAHSLTRSTSQISSFKGTQSRTGMSRSISQTRLADNVTRGNQSRSRSRTRIQSSPQSVSQAINSVKENKKQGRLRRGRMARSQSSTRTVESDSESSKSSEIYFQSKNKKKKFDVNCRKTPNDLTFGKSSKVSILKQRKSRTNKMISAMVGRSKKVHLSRTVPKVESGRDDGTNDNKMFPSARLETFSSLSLAESSLEEAREMPCCVSYILDTVLCSDHSVQ